MTIKPKVHIDFVTSLFKEKFVFEICILILTSQVGHKDR